MNDEPTRVERGCGAGVVEDEALQLGVAPS